MTQKIAINTDFGGFGLSDEAINLYKVLTGIPPVDEVNYWELARNNVTLVQIIEQLGERANGHYSSLKIIEIPDNVEWHIHEYDGMEHVAENHRTWR
jgi:hypothetical protein